MPSYSNYLDHRIELTTYLRDKAVLTEHDCTVVAIFSDQENARQFVARINDGIDVGTIPPAVEPNVFNDRTYYLVRMDLTPGDLTADEIELFAGVRFEPAPDEAIQRLDTQGLDPTSRPRSWERN